MNLKYLATWFAAKSTMYSMISNACTMADRFGNDEAKKYAYTMTRGMWQTDCACDWPKEADEDVP